MSYENYSPGEVEARGEEIYEQFIRDEVESEHRGRFVVIDIETGKYELADTDLQATRRMLDRRPDAVLYGIRIGYPAAYRLGGHSATESR